MYRRIAVRILYRKKGMSIASNLYLISKKGSLYLEELTQAFVRDYCVLCLPLQNVVLKF